MPKKVFKATWLTFAPLAILYIWTASPAMGPLDSPEFIAASMGLGIPHSPGHPLPVFIGKVFSLIPLGEIAWRINAFNSMTMALAGALFFRCCIQAQLVFNSDRKPEVLLPWLSTLTIFVSWPIWEHASRTEVYAFSFLTLLFALFSLLKWLELRRMGWLFLSCFFIGLGFSNHHWMTLCFALPGAILISSKKSLRPNLKNISYSLGFFVLGLLPLLYLPVRSSQHPLVNFGAPHTLKRFLWTYSGSAFTKSINGDESLSLFWSLSEALNACLSGTGIVLGVAFLASLLGLKNQSKVWVALSLLGSICFTVLGRALLGFDASTPDHHAYLIPAIAVIALLATQHLSIHLQGKSSLQKPLIIATLALTFGFRFYITSGTVNKKKAWSSLQIAEWEFSKILPRSVVLISYFQTSFRWWALSSVYGHRPDIAVLDRSFMTYPGYPDETIYRQPTLKKLVDAPVKAGVNTPLEILNEMKNPLYIQYHPNLDKNAVLASYPAGSFAALFAPKSAAPLLKELDLNAAKELETIQGEALPSETRNVFDARLWHNITRMNALCIKGERHWAKAIYSSLPKQVSDDPEIQTIAEHCELN